MSLLNFDFYFWDLAGKLVYNQKHKFDSPLLKKKTFKFLLRQLIVNTYIFHQQQLYTHYLYSVILTHILTYILITHTYNQCCVNPQKNTFVLPTPKQYTNCTTEVSIFTKCQLPVPIIQHTHRRYKPIQRIKMPNTFITYIVTANINPILPTTNVHKNNNHNTDGIIY